MKKFISLLLSLMIITSSAFGYSISASASVVYDKDKISDTANYTALTIYGTNYYKYAFSCLNKINSNRTDNGVAKLSMDKDLLEASMLYAHELVAHWGLERANGDSFRTLVDDESNTIYQANVSTSSSPNASTSVAEKFLSKSQQVLISEDVLSAGVGCFESQENGTTYWVLVVSKQKAQKVVTSSDYEASVSKSEKIALNNDYLSAWEESHTHTYVTSSVTKASASKKTNGKVYKKCKTCGSKTSTTVYYPKTVTLSNTSYVYNGKTRKPTVTVKNSKGKTISSSNYTISYPSGRKDVGKYVVTITFKNNYTGTIKKTFTIKPKATEISSIKAGEQSFTVKWSKRTTQTTGYEIQYATNSGFTKNCNTITISKNTTTSKVVKELGVAKKYYVRVRTYKKVTVNGEAVKIYSAWTDSKAVTTSNTVYVTPTGSKYHYRKSCAGKNAKSTTLSKAKKSYEPCKKCAD